jgi:cytochrome c biogenesis protein CcdA
VVLVLGILTSLALFVFVLRFIIGSFFVSHFIQIQALLGGLIVVLGILTMSESLRVKLRLSRLGLTSQPKAPTGILSVYVIGLGYSLIAAPCAGPAILAIVSLLVVEIDVLILVILFLSVAIGVAIPYLAIALVTGEARTKLAMSISEKTRKIELVVGAIVVIVGVILVLPLFGIRLLF